MCRCATVHGGMLVPPAAPPACPPTPPGTFVRWLRYSDHTDTVTLESAHMPDRTMPRRVPRARIRLAALLLMTLATGACSAAFQQPEIRFDGVRLGSIGLRGGLLYARIQVTNPNRFAFETSALSYDLELRSPGSADGDEGRWVRLAEGTYAEAIRVEGRDSTSIEIPIEFTYSGLDGALRSVIDRGTVSYRVGGVVEVRDPVRRSVPYRRTGVVPIGG